MERLSICVDGLLVERYYVTSMRGNPFLRGATFSIELKRDVVRVVASSKILYIYKILLEVINFMTFTHFDRLIFLCGGYRYRKLFIYLAFDLLYM